MCVIPLLLPLLPLLLITVVVVVVSGDGGGGGNDVNVVPAQLIRYADVVVVVVVVTELQSCPLDMFKCSGSNYCIDFYLLCDGYNDCPDGSDEFLTACCYISQ